MSVDTTEQVIGRMIAYRVLGASNDYLSSRPAGVGDFTRKWNNRPKEGAITELRIGGRPNEYIANWREAWAGIVGPLTHSDEWIGASDADSARDTTCARLAKDLDLPDSLQERCGLWLTVSVSETCQLSRSGRGRYGWASLSEAMDLGSSFITEMSLHLDRVVAAAEASTGVDFSIPVATGDRVFFLAPGLAAFAAPEFSVEGVRVSVTQAWNAIPFGAMTARIDELETVPKKIAATIGEAQRWLMLSRNEPKDRLRAFLFSFLGLERLARSLRPYLLEAAQESLQPYGQPALPVAELFWPPSANGARSSPDRSLVFDFAVVATVLTPETASTDVAEMKGMNSNRQRIAHGIDFDLHSFPTSECRSLLKRYISLASAHDWSQTGHD